MSEANDILESLRYPVGRFHYSADESPGALIVPMETLERFPGALARAVAALSPGGLDRTYRPAGWTARQVVHHVADSHLNGYTRWKLALTEDNPTIKPYDQQRWAQQADVAAVDPLISLQLLEALHARWVSLIRSLPQSAFARTYRNPQMDRPMSLGESLQLYAWHCHHHLAHVMSIRG